MSSLIAPRALPELQVVDLRDVDASELTGFWEREVTLWRERLYWDVSAAVSALERAVHRGGLAGKAVRSGGSTVAYAYYVVERGRGVISGLVVAPPFRSSQVGRSLLEAVLEELTRQRVRRIETQFIALDTPGVVSWFESAGFETHWREFLRVSVSGPRPQPDEPRRSPVHVLPWKAWDLSEAASVMVRAHQGGADAAMNELYRTANGCRTLLDNILRQRGCGRALPEVCSIARDVRSDKVAGFNIVTEIARRHGHLAQVAVDPGFQGRGVGHHLIEHTVRRLGELGAETLSLMVSRGNRRAMGLYRSLGFETVCPFPVFSWSGR